jgi:hypothetical protein
LLSWEPLAFPTDAAVAGILLNVRRRPPSLKSHISGWFVYVVDPCLLSVLGPWIVNRSYQNGGTKYTIYFTHTSRKLTKRPLPSLKVQLLFLLFYKPNENMSCRNGDQGNENVVRFNEFSFVKKTDMSWKNNRKPSWDLSNIEFKNQVNHFFSFHKLQATKMYLSFTA